MNSSESLLDRELLDETAGTDVEGLHELIDMYLAQADDMLAHLRTAISSGAAADIDALAHKLAGSSAVCGVKAMVGPLRALEQRGREKRLAGADELLDRTVDQLETCRNLLSEYLAEKESAS
jgi:HPt (histidine-containing phosphotransfer) domain-containing protein